MAAVANYGDLNGTPDNIVSASSFTSTAQGTLSASINNNVTILDLGLETTDAPTFAGLSITGDATFGDQATDTVTINGNLIVEGNTTTVSTTNLTIEDKFISLGSGSISDASAGIVVERSAGGNGTGLFWDNSTKMWSIDKATANANSNSATVDLKIATIQHNTTVPSNPDYGAAGSSYAAAKGSLFIDTNDDFGVYIWV